MRCTDATAVPIREDEESACSTNHAPSSLDRVQPKGSTKARKLFLEDYEYRDGSQRPLCIMIGRRLLVSTLRTVPTRIVSESLNFPDGLPRDIRHYMWYYKLLQL